MPRKTKRKIVLSPAERRAVRDHMASVKRLKCQRRRQYAALVIKASRLRARIRNEHGERAYDSPVHKVRRLLVDTPRGTREWLELVSLREQLLGLQTIASGYARLKYSAKINAMRAAYRGETPKTRLVM